MPISTDRFVSKLIDNALEHVNTAWLIDIQRETGPFMWITVQTMYTKFSSCVIGSLLCLANCNEVEQLRDNPPLSKLFCGDHSHITII